MFNNQIWLQKYRPKTIQDLAGNRQAIRSLKACIQQHNIPNLILSGPPGTGKTSSILCIARAMFKDVKQYKSSVKQLNASDQRGIDVVRTDIKQFAKSMVKLQNGQVKIVILDQADSLTQGAQQALRMIISDYSQTTRFVLSCNDSSKLIDPIQSRCVIVRFSKLKPEQIESCVVKVSQLQSVRITQSGIQAILFSADGDMRQAINNLQACHFACQTDQQIDDLTVYRVCDTPPMQQLKRLIQDTKSGDIIKALARNKDLFSQGHSPYDIVNSLYRVLLTMQNQISKPKMFQMVRSLVMVKKRVLQGLGTQLQVAGWISTCCQL